MGAPLERDVLHAAAHWFVQLNAAPPTDAQRQAWARWLSERPAHAQAWARVEKLQRQLGVLPGQLSLDTLADARGRRRSALKVLALLLAAGAGGWSFKASDTGHSLMAQYRTRTGERRPLQLADGTRLDLDTATAIDVDYGNRVRAIRLYHGELLIQTAVDSQQRPFVVHTGQGSVRALGTRFTVRSEAGTTRVAVLHSAVQLRPAQAPGSVLRLEQGQQASFDARAVQPASAMAAGASAWAQGMLTVVDWRLADFLAELGRYRPGVLRCAPQVAQLRLSGAFRLDDTDQVLENLGTSLAVKVRYMSRYWVSVEPA